jgi:hypothetical protein
MSRVQIGIIRSGGKYRFGHTLERFYVAYADRDPAQLAASQRPIPPSSRWKR